MRRRQRWSDAASAILSVVGSQRWGHRWTSREVWSTSCLVDYVSSTARSRRGSSRVVADDVPALREQCSSAFALISVQPCPRTRHPARKRQSQVPASLTRRAMRGLTRANRRGGAFSCPSLILDGIFFDAAVAVRVSTGWTAQLAALRLLTLPITGPLGCRRAKKVPGTRQSRKYTRSFYHPSRSDFQSAHCSVCQWEDGCGCGCPGLSGESTSYRDTGRT